MAIYDFGRSSSNQKYTFSKVEHFKIISIQKQTFADWYSDSEQYGLTVGFIEFRHA